MWLAFVCLAAVLLALALPRSLAELAATPGRAATDRLIAGERVSESSFARALSALQAALRWHDAGRWHRQLGMVEIGYAQFLEPAAAAPLRAEGLQHLLVALARAPADSHAWLVLARTLLDAGERLQAAGALDWAVRTMPFDPDNAGLRALLGLALWELLEPPTQARLRSDLFAWFRREPRAVVAFAARSRRIDLVADLLAADERTSDRFTALLAELERKAMEEGPDIGEPR
ncbi:hypothetical protein HRbin40_02090 [bacterium HR40]|nr:hypothetical protein HRbin40_02090 [bacterium HR40]